MLLLKTKRIFTVAPGPILAVLLGCLAFSARAAVQVTRFDPPINISAYADVSADQYVNVFAADFNADGVVDFRLGSGLGAMGAYFNAPVRFGQRVTQPGGEGRFGPLGAVPLGSTIGTNIISPVATNYYAWSSGSTNRDDLTQPLGDHETTVIIANLVNFNIPSGGTVIIITNGWNGTNINFPRPPVISGDVAYQDAVMAVEFYIDGQRHYGYIHFDFSGGAGGVIYGWAYETQANTPIEAASLAPAVIDTQPQQHSGVVGMVQQVNQSGWTVSISTANGTFVKSVPADDDGYFKVDLAPGSYVLQPLYLPQAGPGQPVSGALGAGMRKPVRVTRNQFSFVVLNAAPGKTPRSAKR